MEFFKKKTKFDFVAFRKSAAVISIILLIFSIGSLMVRGINWGLDFTGGTLIELHYPKPAELEKIRQSLATQGFPDAVVLSYGTSSDVLIRIAPREGATEQTISQTILAIVRAENPDVKLMRIDAIGAKVGRELAEQGGLALLMALLLTAFYIAFRFEYRFAVSAAVGLAHDPILILGVFSFFQLEFDLNTLAAILAVIGYSLNDTIVVYDRIKENFIKVRKATTAEVVNRSINEMLSRTVITSGSTLMVILALLILGGQNIYGFALALCIGIVVGTYSSIYVASSLAMAMGLSRKDLMPAPKSDVDDRP